MLDYVVDEDLRQKLGQWKNESNFLRVGSAHSGKTPESMLKLSI